MLMSCRRSSAVLGLLAVELALAQGASSASATAFAPSIVPLTLPERLGGPAILNATATAARAAPPPMPRGRRDRLDAGGPQLDQPDEGAHQRRHPDGRSG
jgi:hypothetical protein